MPGYVIHLAIASEHLKKFKEENEEEFIKGIIYPDSVKDKSLTHFGKLSSVSNVYDFLMNININTSFNRGYFLHLVTDYLFYNKYIEYMPKEGLYNDYDILNDYVVEKYNVNIPKIALSCIHSNPTGELKVLSKELVDTFIEDVSNMDLDFLEKDIKNNKEKWTKMKELKRC